MQKAVIIHSQKRMNKVLILGRIPPPNGGVTVHVSRLIEALKHKKPESFEFIDFRKRPVKACLKLLCCKVVHLHSSNPYLQLFLALACRLLLKKTVITFHGNLGRYGFLKNCIADFSVRLASTPIVLNTESLHKARIINKNAICLTAFIPASIPTSLNPQLLENLHKFREKYKILFCTNAWKLTFDKHGNEIYGITGIIRNLEKTTHAGLVISDSSGSYEVYIQKLFGKIPDHVFTISEKHDFRNVLALCDAFIRNTTTDGDSLSIHEAIDRKVIVFASDCVTRPFACRLFSNIELVDFVSELQIPQCPENPTPEHYEDVVKKLLNVYETYL
jgi:glycosyltransferase involved in cell wall biosynthesis